MKMFSKTSTERNHHLIFAFIFLAAVGLRLATVFLTIPVPGDGPVRAAKAFLWADAPSIQTHGLWLPGYMYLVGTVSFLFKDPNVPARLVNLVLGSLSILVFYLLIRKVFDSMTALVSSSILAFFPMHVGLSAGDLTEATFAFEIIAGSLFFLEASESEAAKRRLLYLSVSLFFLCLGVMTRYEAWVLIPVFPVYYFLRRRKICESLTISAVLTVFPIIWTLNNYLRLGHPFWGFTRATGWHHGAQPVNLFSAIVIIIGQAAFHIGFVVPVLAAAGFVVFFLQREERPIDIRKMFYIAITGIFWAGVLAYTLARGESLWDRYLLFAFITTLPFAALPLTYYYERHKKNLLTAILLAVVLVVSVVFKPGAYSRYLNMPQSRFYVTFVKPTEMMNVAFWLKNSSYGESSVLLTGKDSQASYLFTYFPEIRQRCFIVKGYVEDIKIKRFLKSQRPSLLIAFGDDSNVVSRIQDILGTKIGTDRLIYSAQNIKIYDIKSAVDAF